MLRIAGPQMKLCTVVDEAHTNHLGSGAMHKSHLGPEDSYILYIGLLIMYSTGAKTTVLDRNAM